MGERLRHVPPLEVTRIHSAIWIDTWWQPIPQRNLIITHFNGAIIAEFNLDGACFAAEGGVRGYVDGEPIELTNFGGEEGDGIGLTDDFYVDGLYTTEPPHFKKVFDFYEKLLKAMFEGQKGIDVLAGRFSTPEQTLGRINEVLKEVGGEDMSQKVRQRLTGLHQTDRAYLRGLTDEEIEKTYVPRPVTIIRARRSPRPN